MFNVYIEHICSLHYMFNACITFIVYAEHKNSEYTLMVYVMFDIYIEYLHCYLVTNLCFDKFMQPLLYMIIIEKMLIVYV